MEDRLTALNAQLEALVAQERRCAKLDVVIADLTAQRQERQGQVDRTAALLEREEADVTRLESMSLRGLLLSLTGDKEERLLQERREAAAARLGHDQAVRDLAYIEGELKKAKEERRTLAAIPRRRTELLEEKAAIFVAQGGESGRRLAALEEELTHARAQRRELAEAISAGRQAVAALEQVQEELDSAEGWGVWDMLGGGLVSTLVKHSHIDEAKCGLDEVQHALSRFRTELADVNAANCPQIQIGEFATFADWFFDGLLADWYVQSGIHDAQDGVSETRYRVREVLGGLEEQSRTLEAALSELERRRQDILKA